MYKNCKKKKKKSNSCEANSLQFLLSLSRLITITIFFSFSIESTTSLNEFNDNLLSIEKYIRVPERKKERKEKR